MCVCSVSPLSGSISGGSQASLIERGQFQCFVGCACKNSLWDVSAGNKKPLTEQRLFFYRLFGGGAAQSLSGSTRRGAMKYIQVNARKYIAGIMVNSTL